MRQDRKRSSGLVAGAFAIVALVAITSAEQTRAEGQTKPEAPPNIIFMCSDDHAYQAISAYGDPRKLIETPNIDRLGKEGIRFDRCVVPNSICGPSRATILTGQYNHINGFYNNAGSVFDSSQTTFVRLLQDAGYQTAIVGKWHLGSDPVGFDYWKILVGQGTYHNPLMIDNGQRIRREGYVTDLITEDAIDWLKTRDRSKPFLLMYQQKAPHREWVPAVRHLGHDDDRDYPEPSTLFDDYSSRGLAERDQDMTIEKTLTDRDLKFITPNGLSPEELKLWNAYYEPRNQAFQEANLQGKDLVRWKYNRYMHDYLGCIKSVDEGVGQLLEYLDAEGLAENTIVVYNADQGFFLGEHGWFDKRWIYEESLRAPLLIRWPGVIEPGRVNSDLVSNLDFAETFLDAAGVEIPESMQGRSFLPILQGETPDDWRKSFYYEYYEYPAPHRVRPHYGVVTDRYKLVHFYIPDVDYWELFDRQEDPEEIHNVIDDPKYADVVQELRDELARLRQELKVPDVPPKEAYGRLFTPRPKRPGH